jgi:hypothetical protein
MGLPLKFHKCFSKASDDMICCQGRANYSIKKNDTTERRKKSPLVRVKCLPLK